MPDGSGDSRRCGPFTEANRGGRQIALTHRGALLPRTSGEAPWLGDRRQEGERPHGQREAPIPAVA